MSDFVWRPGGFRRPVPARGAKTPLTRDQIVEAALRIVIAEGIDAVSMRRIAGEFHTGPSSLYAHVSNKDELLQLMFDEMCRQVTVPEPDPARWKDQLKEIARSGYQIMVAHNDLARAALGTIPSGPNALRISEGMLTILLAAGVPPGVAAWVLDRIFLYIVADAYEFSIWRADADVERLTTDLAAYFDQLPADDFPNIRRYAGDMVSGDTTDRFEFGLELMVGGLDQYVIAPAPTE